MEFQYSRWRHGGWYVDNVRYPSGACGCVSRNYEDRKWRIACDPRPFGLRPTFRNRDEAAEAERRLIEDLEAYRETGAYTGTDGWREDWEAFEAWRIERAKPVEQYVIPGCEANRSPRAQQLEFLAAVEDWTSET